MRMLRKPSKETRSVFAIAVIVACVIATAIGLKDLLPRPVNPLVAQLAPGAAPAIVRALGPSGLDRITQVISPGNARTWYSAGTHLASGSIDGRPYGNAFDIEIDSSSDPDADTRALRLQGIAAWRRGPDAPGGAEELAPHIHCVWPGYPSHNPENTEQISSFVHGWRALADRGKPKAEWRDLSIRADEIARVRGVYERVHGVGALSNAATYDSLHRSAASG